MIPPEEVMPKNLAPFTCKSSRLPANPLAALTPRPVPLVLHAVEVVPLGSIRSWGLVVVAVPPLNHVPLSFRGGVEAAPARLRATSPVAPTTLPETPAFAPAEL